VVIVHGCPSNIGKVISAVLRTYDKHWIPWIKKQLSTYDISVKVPLMPKPWAPKYEAFKKKFEKQKVTENTTLIGHSCGCSFLVRWLGDTKQKIDKLILVAPWKVYSGDDEDRKKFYTFDIDNSIKSRTKRIVIFTADNEKPDGKQTAQIFKDTLDGEIIELKGRGHYLSKDMKTEQFPELLKVILE